MQKTCWTMMAQVLIGRAEVDAAVALMSSVIESLPPDFRPVDGGAEEYRRLRADKIQELLLSLERLNPHVAAEIQQILDQQEQSEDEDRNQPDSPAP